MAVKSEMIDKLKELIKDAFWEWECDVSNETIGEMAEHLLLNGVRVPTCKIGDTVYQTDGVRVYPLLIEKIIYDTNGIAFDETAIGKTIFLTREAAEAAKEAT